MANITLENSNSMQFELWQECNNRCVYCFLREDNKKTEDSVKLESLKRTYEIICNPDNYPTHNVIGFIGGEFFQGQLKDPDVRLWFYKVMSKTAELYNNRTIQQVWIPATLNIGNQQDLYQVLDLFNDHDDVWIITSWDSMGRFKTDKMFETWDFHMKNLHNKYPGLKFNITTILTGDFIEKYLDDKISLKNMMNEYHAHFFFKQCGLFANKASESTLEEQMESKLASNEVLANFFPKRKTFLKFLIKFKREESEDMWNRLFNIKFRANELYRNHNDGRTEMNRRYKDTKSEVEDSMITECGHPMVYRAYIDSDECVLCDKERLSLYDV